MKIHLNKHNKIVLKIISYQKVYDRPVNIWRIQNQLFLHLNYHLIKYFRVLSPYGQYFESEYDTRLQILAYKKLIHLEFTK